MGASLSLLLLGFLVFLQGDLSLALVHETDASQHTEPRLDSAVADAIIWFWTERCYPNNQLQNVVGIRRPRLSRGNIMDKPKQV